MPEAERDLLLVVGHLSNELNIFNKLFYWCSNNFSAKEPALRKAHSAQALALARVLAGKFAESWVILRKVYFASRLSKEYHSLLTPEALEALDNLRKYFGKANLVHTIRNRFAFHYDLAEIRSGFALPNDLEEWDIYLAESNGNTLYYVADLVANYALLNSIVPGDLKAAMESLIQELIQVGGWFIAFLGGCMIVLGERYLLDEEGNPVVTEIGLPNTPSLDEIEIPYFVVTPRHDER